MSDELYSESPASVASTQWAVPTSLVVGPHYFTVEVVQGLRSEDHSKGIRLDGRIDHQKLMISIDASLSPTKAFETLWHEVLHEIADLCDLSMPEVTVRLVAPYIAMVLNQNTTMRSSVY